MLKAKLGHSILSDSYESGRETALIAAKGLRNSKLGMLYTSDVYEQSKVIEGVKSVFSDTPVIGCTSCGGVIIP